MSLVHHSVKWASVFLFVIFARFFGPCIASSTDIKYISVTQHPDYQDRVLPALQRFVDQKAKTTTNHFFIEKVDARRIRNGICPWAYWKEGNELIRFCSWVKDAPPEDLNLSNRQINLRKDVYPKDFKGNRTSTFMLDYTYAQDTVQRCLNGTAFTIIKTIPRKKPKSLRIQSSRTKT